MSQEAVRVVPRDQKKPSLLSVVCPAYNEEDVLEMFHLRVKQTLDRLEQPFEIVFVNDGSTDGTLGLLHALRKTHGQISIVNLSRNFGKEIALTAGLDAAKGEAIVVIDADLQDPPELIGELIEGWAEGYDVIYATRKERAGETWLKKKTASAFYKLMAKLGQVRLPENTGDFRLMNRNVVDAICSLRERHRFMKGLFAWAGFSSKAVYYDRDPRAAGTTKWNYRKLWNLSIEGITSSTIAPLKLSSYLGFAVAGFAICAGIFYAIKALIFGDPVAGFPTLITVMLFLGGIQLAVLGVMGEYLGRIFNETKNRPLYFVSDAHDAEAARSPSFDLDENEAAQSLDIPDRRRA